MPAVFIPELSSCTWIVGSVHLAQIIFGKPRRFSNVSYLILKDRTVTTREHECLMLLSFKCSSSFISVWAPFPRLHNICRSNKHTFVSLGGLFHCVDPLRGCARELQLQTPEILSDKHFQRLLTKVKRTEPTLLMKNILFYLKLDIYVALLVIYML